MDKAALVSKFKYFDLVHGVTLRAIGKFTDEQLDFRPKPEVRSVRELIHHIYAGERVLAEGVRAGRITQEDDRRAQDELAQVTTVQAALDYARACHKAAQEALDAVSDEDLTRDVESPFGSFPGWQYFAFAYDEHWHHRGQLYTYLRLLDIEPPPLYDYENLS